MSPNSSTNTVENERAVVDAQNNAQFYAAVQSLVESDADEVTYNQKLRALAAKYGYKTRFVAYTGSCVGGGVTGKHLHLVNLNRDYCPVANNATVLFPERIH